MTNVPPHEELKVSLDFYAINSWDGNDTGVGPDFWDMTVAGSNVVHTTFSNFGGPPYFQRQSYPGRYPTGDFPGQTGASGTNVLGFAPQGQDSVYQISRTLLHTSNAVTVSLTASNLQGLPDEFWGIDNFTVTAINKITNSPICGFYLPEETIKPLFGETGAGQWKLEVWDNRTGGVLSDGVLLAWRLNFTFVNENPTAITLTNGLAYCANLDTNETKFFQVFVPISAKGVTNTVFAGGDVSLVFNQYELPAGQDPPDTFFLNNVPSGVTDFTTNVWSSFDLARTTSRGSNSFPVLIPGRRYYLAVQNNAPGVNSFCI